MAKKPKAKGTRALGTKPRAVSKPSISRRETSNPITHFINDHCRRWRTSTMVSFVFGAVTVIGVILTIVFGVYGVRSYWQGKSAATKEGQEKADRDHQADKEKLENIQRDVRTLTDVVSKANVSDFNAQFPGGCQTFGFLLARSATGEQDTIRSLTSYDVDLACDSAMISDLTPSNFTMQLQNPRITRAKTTPTGTQPAGAVFVNGNAIWKMDRRPKVVSINNAINSWGYVIGGYVLYDKDDVLIVAVGLQKVQ